MGAEAYEGVNMNVLLIPIVFGLALFIIGAIVELGIPKLASFLVMGANEGTTLAFTGTPTEGFSVEELAYDLIYNRLVRRYPEEYIEIPLGDILTQEELSLICTDRLGFARAVDRYAEQVGRKAYFDETGYGTTESLSWIKLGLG